jgi:hypothetical protein
MAASELNRAPGELAVGPAPATTQEVLALSARSFPEETHRQRKLPKRAELDHITTGASRVGNHRELERPQNPNPGVALRHDLSNRLGRISRCKWRGNRGKQGNLDLVRGETRATA